MEILSLNELKLLPPAKAHKMRNQNFKFCDQKANGRTYEKGGSFLQKTPNKLLDEKSPYLLQHAYNPVNWYPWGDEAFAKSKDEDKPIFLSIGYSTCHWCHVMERESFEHRDVAEILNKNFVSIKLDREERPDIDHVYMNVCQVMTGSGGWPLSVFADSDMRPFFAGTYFTKETFKLLLEQISNTYKTNRSALDHTYQKIITAIEGYTPGETSTIGNPQETAFSYFVKAYDAKNGGFGTAPKFPTPHIILFLLAYYKAYNKKDALYMAEGTLDAMRRGGIYDHIGFGFSRYSTDEKWLAPHFEKMLYDNSLLAYAYAKAYSVTSSEKHFCAAQCTLDYITRVLQSPEGGFYSAEDADSEGVEGKFYLWTKSEVEKILKEDATEFCALYDITQAGNFDGKNIPNLIKSEIPKIKLKWADGCIDKLFSHREKRVHPFLDDKVLTSWNGLAIAAFAYAGRILKRDDYIESACNAANFIGHKLTDKNGGLLSRYRDGESKYTAHAEDYAFYIWGLIELYRAAGDVRYLEKAQNLTETFIDDFWDNDNGGFNFISRKGERLITNPKDVYDSAMPSANSVCAMNMLRLGVITGDAGYSEFAERIFSAFSSDIAGNPAACAFLTLAYLYKKSDIIKVEIKTKNQSDVREFLNLIPNDAEVLISEPAHGMQTDGRTGAEFFVCKGRKCYPPVSTTEELLKLLM